MAEAGELGGDGAIRIANRDPKVVDQRRRHPGLSSTATIVEGSWEVSYYDGAEQVALAIVDPASGEVRESWTGYQVAWKMARGYSGAFGHKLNAPYVFLPLCAVFLIGLVDWRRPWRLANLDLLALLGFALSHWFFNRAEIGVSVPLQYLPLTYLLGRALWIGLRGGDGIRSSWPAAWLALAALFLLGFRAGLNIADSGVIDVGYASVVGADRIAHGEALYEGFPADVSQGDTYGPANYLAYVPFEAIWPWAGSWDELPAAHGAAVLFDLATVALLALLGLRLRPGARGRALAATLAFGWAAFPYTAFVLESNSNDALVVALLIAALLVLARPAARGAVLAAATLTKFAPLLLAPMLATYRPDPSRSGPAVSTTGPAIRRSAVLFALAFAGAIAVLMLWPAIDPGLASFYERTLGYQAERDSPFSLWGQVPSLEPLRIALLALAGAMSLAFAWRPRRKTLGQVAALGAALIIAVQLAAQHWFYLYIVWFYPLLLVAMASPGRAASPARSSPPGPAS
jgi:hypothetical protein